MGELAADGIEAGALGFSTLAHGRPQVEERRIHAALTATRDELLGIARGHRRDRARRVRDRGRPRRPRRRVRAHPRHGRGERTPAVDHGAAAAHPGRHVPPHPRPHLAGRGRRRAAVRPGGVAAGRAHHAPRQPDEPVRGVADVPEARRAPAATRSRRRSATPSCASVCSPRSTPLRDRSPLTIFSDAYEFGTPLKYDPDPGDVDPGHRGEDRPHAVRGRPRRARQGGRTRRRCTSPS